MPTKLDTVSFKTTLKASGITNLDDAVDTIKKFHLNESIVTLSKGGCTSDGVLIKTKDIPSISDEIMEGIKSINRRG
jgi:hypothetical protein